MGLEGVCNSAMGPGSVYSAVRRRTEEFVYPFVASLWQTQNFRIFMIFCIQLHKYFMIQYFSEFGSKIEVSFVDCSITCHTRFAISQTQIQVSSASKMIEY